MSKFEQSKFFEKISSFLKSEKQDETCKNEKVLDENIEIVNKVWKKETKPLREIMLWGWDEDNNPSFLILYGRQKFVYHEEDDQNSEKILEDNVNYDCYAIFKGNEGHMPSFQSVKIIKEDEDADLEMYYKKGVSYNWGWYGNADYIIEDFYNLEEDDALTLPYFIKQSYEQYVQKIKETGKEFEGFKIAKNQNEVLNLDASITQFSEIIINIIGKNNIYLRKKLLKELISKNPPKEVYKVLLEKGSSELISGLFLELAKSKNSILNEEAKSLVESEITWVEENYAKGVKRCAKLYINSLDEDLRANRIDFIKKTLSNMDLHLIKLWGKDIEKDKVIPPTKYRMYALCGYLEDYSRYSGEEGDERYKVGPYTNGRTFNLIELKNTIQESEVYELADVIGKIAYYVDAPRLTYHFKGNRNIRGLRYFHRYLKRIINGYAKNDPDKFIEAMKHLLTSYTPNDYVCKFKENYQFNELMKYYLYYDFKEKPPVYEDWKSWGARHDWFVNDQLMKLEGRNEYMKEIWDDHLEDVADIAMMAKIPPVLKACYYILKDSPKLNEFVQNISDKKLIDLAVASYEPLANMFSNILSQKLDEAKEFDPKLMITMLGYTEKEIQLIAVKYFENTNGSFTPESTADLFLLDNLRDVQGIAIKNILEFDCDKYVQFIKYLINKIGNILDKDNEISEDLKSILSTSTKKIDEVSKDKKQELVEELILDVFKERKIPEWMAVFTEEVIFSISYEELSEIVLSIDIEASKRIRSSRNKRIISILQGIKSKNLLKDKQIIDILEFGSSNMLKILFAIVEQSAEELNDRMATILIMLESDVTTLNEIAKEVFESMSGEKQRRLHAMIIDSPVARVYEYGLSKLDMIYGDLIPEEFIIQMLEHTSPAVKAYIADKTDRIINNLSESNVDVFMYYVKTLLFLPNRVSKSKHKVYQAIPKFVLNHRDKVEEVESILLNIGGSNIISDSERALVALAKVREGGMILEG